MLFDASYLNNSILPFSDSSQPLIVGSCGCYRFSGEDCFHTRRPQGRKDYQLLYVAAGTAWFEIDGNRQPVHAGSMILYRPFEPQHYEYYGQDGPEIYWVHFTGGQVEHILEEYRIRGTLQCKRVDACSRLFQNMIRELKNCAPGFQDLLAMYLRQILILIWREGLSERSHTEQKFREQMEQAIRYFTDNLDQQISIENYAGSIGMSVSWFLRCFKAYTRQSPKQYITALRINNAVNLLENTNYPVSQIAAMVGYDDPFYFSRLFRKTKGVSPSSYRKR